MAGLMLDTKNFTMRTGARTFEAAAFLRQAGGDTGEVKKLFQNDLSDTMRQVRTSFKTPGCTARTSPIAPVDQYREPGNGGPSRGRASKH